MKLIFLLAILTTFILFESCKDQAKENNGGSIIANGQMPNITKDHSGILHLVYGNRDSILYSFSPDGGNTFSSAALISILPDLAASHMRGPQIAVTDSSVI